MQSVEINSGFGQIAQECCEPLPQPEACLHLFFTESERHITSQLNELPNRAPKGDGVHAVTIDAIKSWRTSEKARLEREFQTLQSCDRAVFQGSHQMDYLITRLLEKYVKVQVDVIKTSQAELIKKREEFRGDDEFFSIARELPIRQRTISLLAQDREAQDLARRDLKDARTKQFDNNFGTRGYYLRQAVMATYELMKVNQMLTWLQTP